MHLRRLLRLLPLAAALAAATVRAQTQRPNIIVILADDMGFSDIHCYGGDVPTPNIDRLAERGVRFTQFYNVARCCPSRATILTGLYSHEVGIGHMIQDDGVAGYRGFLNQQCVTIAEALKPAGYYTAIAGKWHIGSAPDHWPLARGFDNFYGSLTGGFYYRPTGAQCVVEDNHVLYTADRPPPAGWYSTDAWTDHAIGFIDKARERHQPFFLYLAYNSPHFPLQAPQEEIAKWRGKYRRGWDALREERYKREIKLGIIDPAWALSPRDRSDHPGHVKAWTELSAKEQDRFDQIMATYAAVLQHMDTAIGRVVAALDERKLTDNTLILFLSDNGANAESGPNGRLEGAAPGSANSVVYVGQSWATLSNTPFRYYKHYDFEGGISTPLIAQWPAGIKDGGSLRPQVGHIVDIMATCLDVAGASYPTTYAGHAILPLRGRSLVPAFANQPMERGPLFWEHEGNAAMRSGDWKLVRLGRQGAWQLYDLKRDRTELNDLAASHADLVKDLAGQWEHWAHEVHVYPLPGRNPARRQASANAADDQS